MDFGTLILAHLVGDYLLQNDFIASRKTSSSAVCALHVTLYTLPFIALTMGQWPPWAYVVIALVHFPIDRWGLAARAMNRTGQRQFAKSMPWSIIIVDNTYHLLTAWLVWKVL